MNNYMLGFILTSLAIANGQMLHEDAPQNTSEVLMPAASSCEMTCGQIKQLVENEWSTQFNARYEEFVTISVRVLRNKTRANGKCKLEGPWCYYDFDMDRCTCCKGDCSPKDLSCVDNCQGYLAYQNQTVINEKMRTDMNMSEKRHQENLATVNASHLTQILVLGGIMLVFFAFQIIIGIVVWSNRDKLLKNSKSPEGDRENLMESTTQCSGMD